MPIPSEKNVPTKSKIKILCLLAFNLTPTSTRTAAVCVALRHFYDTIKVQRTWSLNHWFFFCPCQWAHLFFMVVVALNAVYISERVATILKSSTLNTLNVYNCRVGNSFLKSHFRISPKKMIILWLYDDPETIFHFLSLQLWHNMMKYRKLILAVLTENLYIFPFKDIRCRFLNKRTI